LKNGVVAAKDADKIVDEIIEAAHENAQRHRQLSRYKDGEPVKHQI
jgi:hypothetical protein